MIALSFMSLTVLFCPSSLLVNAIKLYNCSWNISRLQKNMARNWWSFHAKFTLNKQPTASPAAAVREFTRYIPNFSYWKNLLNLNVFSPHPYIKFGMFLWVETSKFQHKWKGDITNNCHTLRTLSHPLYIDSYASASLPA